MGVDTEIYAVLPESERPLLEHRLRQVDHTPQVSSFDRDPQQRTLIFGWAATEDAGTAHHWSFWLPSYDIGGQCLLNAGTTIRWHWTTASLGTPWVECCRNILHVIAWLENIGCVCLLVPDNCEYTEPSSIIASLNDTQMQETQNRYMTLLAAQSNVPWVNRRQWKTLP